MPKEKIINNVTREILVEIRIDNIERVFHLPVIDQYQNITYDMIEKWYREHEWEENDLVQEKYLIVRPSPNKREKKVDMVRGYMVNDISYYIILLSRVMGLLVDIHLENKMVHFIETIKKRNTKINLDT